MKKLGKNKFTVLAAVSLAVITLVAGTFAWFTSNKQLVNTLKTNTNDVTIVEEFDPEKPFTPGIDFTKKVAAQNKGEEPLLVRLSFSEAWYDKTEAGEKGGLRADLPTTNVSKNFDLNADNSWNYFNSANAATVIANSMDAVDGYFYYDGVLDKGLFTQILLKSVTMSDVNANDYAGCVYELTVNVEAVQANPGTAAVETWAQVADLDDLQLKISVEYDADGNIGINNGATGLADCPLTINELMIPTKQ